MITVEANRTLLSLNKDSAIVKWLEDGPVMTQEGSKCPKTWNRLVLSPYTLYRTSCVITAEPVRLK